MGELLVFIGIGVIVFFSLKRSERFAVLAVLGLVALIVGVVLLLNAGNIINFEAVRSAEDVGTVTKAAGIVLLVVIAGGFILVRSLRAFARQKKFEWRTDKFHDAWNSRKDRWL